MPVKCSVPCRTASRRSSVCSGQMTMSPSSRGPALPPSSSTPKESTSVGALIWRYWWFSSCIRAPSTNSIATWPSAIPAEARASVHSSSTSMPVGSATAAASSPITSMSSNGLALRPLARPELRGETLCVLVIRSDDAAHELVTNDVLLAEADELNPLHVTEDVRHNDQTRVLLTRQVDLRHVTGDHHLGVEPQPGEEHLHLLRAGVLRLVEDDEAVIQGAAPHERQRCHLDHAPLQVLADALRLEHVVQGVEQRA